MNIFKLFIGSIITILSTLYFWKIFYIYNCWVLIFPLFILLVISSSYIQLKLQERRCFRECYFQKNSFLSKMFSSKILVIIFYILLSVMMSVTTIYSVIDFSDELWIYLIIHIFIVVILYKSLLKIFSKVITDRYLPLFAREWSINISTIFLLGAFVYITLNTYEPSYLSDTLQDTITKASHSIGSQCEYIDTILRIKIELDSTFWWITNKATYFIKDKMLNSIVWIVFIIINSIALLGLNRFIVQIVHTIDKFSTTKTDEKNSLFYRLSLFEKLFWSTIFALFLAFMIFNIMAIFNAPQNHPQIDKNSTISQRWVDKYIASDKIRDNLNDSQYLINNNLNSELRVVYEQIDVQMSELFKPAKDNVDKFLDFHYSVAGEYTELGAMAMGDMQKLIREKLFGSDFAERLALSSENISKTYAQGIDRHLTLIDTYAKKDVDIELNAQALEILQRDINSSKLLQKEKLGALLAVRFGPKLMQPIVTKLVAAGTAKVATKSATKAGAKIVAAGSGVAAGTICGPFVWVCAPVAAVSLWVATDIAVVSADEYISRDDFKREILASLTDKEKILKKNYKELYYHAFNDFSKEVKQHYTDASIQEKQRVKIIDKL
jgi:uncharacterized membrane protein